MVEESDKWAIHDQTLLAWDKEKHNVLEGFELRKHRESMVQQERMIIGISDSMKDVSNSF